MVNTQLPHRLVVIDSHTAGEPTRCVLSGGPHLGAGSLSERLERLRRDHDIYRRAILCEPRGSDVLVGAFLLEPVDPACATGVIFFNNAGYLGMCGHGIIGVTATLAYQGAIRPGEHLIETPVGRSRWMLRPDNQVSCRNIPAYRYRAGVTVQVPGIRCGHRGCSVGRQLVFPGAGAHFRRCEQPESLPGGTADCVHRGDSPGADGSRHHRSRWSGD